MRASRRDRYYNDYPEPVTGYELNSTHGLLSVIIPEATTNLIANPSLEKDAVGYAGSGGAAVAATYNWQAYGAVGLQITPAVSAESGAVYAVDLSSGTTYTFSVTIQGEAGKLYYVWFATNVLALLGSKRVYIGTGHKQRIWVTYTETANANRRVCVTRDGKYADQNLWYADGFQVEAKSYPTTYCDGDLKGFLVNESPVPYLWNGLPGASTSTRSAQTRTGGREMNLIDLGFRLLAILGLGMAPLVDQSLPLPGYGEFPQGTGTQAREFSLIGSLVSDGSRHLSALLDGLEGAFKPDLVTKDQPLILHYQAYEEGEEEPCGDTLEIICKYRGGLEGAVTNHLGERLALNFKMYVPFLKQVESKGSQLGYQTNIANANYILKRSVDGVWSAMGTGTNGTVYAMAVGPDGSIYVGGSFTNLGDASGDYISRWTGSAWQSLGTGINAGGGAGVLCMIITPDGSLYVGGDFADAGGVANTAYLARWDGANWFSVGAGAITDIVGALAWGPDGKLYIGGEFTNVGDANGDKIVSWNGAAFASLGTGMQGAGGVSALVFGQDGALYAGGVFSSAGGVAGTVDLAQWYGGVWNSMGSVMDGAVNALAIGPDGSLYVGGNFSAASTPANSAYLVRWDTSHVISFNTSQWRALGSGVNGGVNSLKTLQNGSLYVGGTFTTAGGITLPDRVARWNGFGWFPLDVDLPGANFVYAVEMDKAGNLYLGFDFFGTAVSATVTVPTVGSSTTFPKIIFTGPGTISQIKNYTTGKGIYFNLTMLAGEVAVLDLNPQHISFISTWRGDLLYTIRQGSDLLFELLPGTNNISAYYYTGATAASNIVIYWQDQYWSINGATWK